ncbi:MULTISPECIES: hypothetical protein [Methanothermobacter]|uniref:Uncharacterized protein n=1 Tax=Methanothermobacter wolfeii TaxID=145261 RepID=A0A9E7UHY4_METWO|nr:hypothetical protein [Methanothermobacter wolfeii]UXH32659.1 hypothetical protein N5910_09375 [Methanothermobacter wolfeii]
MSIIIFKIVARKAPSMRGTSRISDFNEEVVVVASCRDPRRS